MIASYLKDMHIKAWVVAITSKQASASEAETLKSLFFTETIISIIFISIQSYSIQSNPIIFNSIIFNSIHLYSIQ